MGCKLLNISLKLLTILSICQRFKIIYFIFGSTGLYVNENDIVVFTFGFTMF